MTYLLLLGYLVGVLVASVLLTRAAYSLHPNKPRCHQEPNSGNAFDWPTRELCMRYDKPGCWRVDPAPPVTVRDAVRGSAAAAVWPIALFGLIPLFALRINQRMVRPSLVSVADIARMERELGIEEAA